MNKIQTEVKLQLFGMTHKMCVFTCNLTHYNREREREDWVSVYEFYSWKIVHNKDADENRQTINANNGKIKCIALQQQSRKMDHTIHNANVLFSVAYLWFWPQFGPISIVRRKFFSIIAILSHPTISVQRADASIQRDLNALIIYINKICRERVKTKKELQSIGAFVTKRSEP